MKKNINKKNIIFSLFALVCLLAFGFTVNNSVVSGTKRVSINDVNNLEEVNLGDKCEAKDYNACGCNEISDAYGKKMCQNSCKICAEAKITGVQVLGNNYIYLANGEQAKFNFIALTNASSFTPKWSFSPSQGAYGELNGTIYTLYASGTGSGGGNSCKETSYRVTASSSSSSASATVKVCRYCNSWQGPIPVSSSTVFSTKQNTDKYAEGCVYYIGEGGNAQKGYTYTAYYNRCCNSVVTPTPTPTPKPIVKYCYGDKKYLGIASNVGWQEKETTERPYKYDGISESECHAINVSTCNVSPTSPMAIEAKTENCEDVKEISYKDVTKCSNYDSSTENNFYTIECNRKISTSFDYGDDNNTKTVRFLYKGQGFKFGVKVISTHICTAKFNKTAWEKTYNTFLQKIKYVNSSLVNYVKNYDKTGWTKAVNALNASKETKSEVYALWNIIENLRNVVVNDYLGFTPSNKYEENVNLSIKYNVNGKSNTQNEILVLSEKDSTEGKYTKTVSNVKYNLTNQSALKNVPEYYVISNENDPRVLKFIPSNAYLDKYLGLSISTTDNDTINGGNKIYVDYKIDSTTNSKPYNMTINVTGLGSNRSSVINAKCDLKIGGEELLYRPIDVSNPFINSKWNIGENWLNSKYSFTNTIKSNIWAMNKLYDIKLSNEDIASLKESNRTYKDKYPYLGLCERMNTPLQDNITKRLCGIIKSTID